MNTLKQIVIKYVDSFKECKVCNYMCSKKHFTQNNYNKSELNVCNECLITYKNKRSV